MKVTYMTLTLLHMLKYARSRQVITKSGNVMPAVLTGIFLA